MNKSDISNLLITIIVILFLSLTPALLVVSMDSLKSWSEIIYYLGSGIGGLSIFGFGFYALLRGVSKYEEIAIDIEKEKLALQKSEPLRRMKSELSNDVLTAFHELKISLNIIRAPFVSFDEVKALEKLTGISAIKIQENIGLNIRLRMWQEQKKLEDLYKLRPRFDALFENAEDFESINRLWSHIFDTAKNIERLNMSNMGKELITPEKMSVIMADPTEASDLTAEKIKKIISSIEEKCKPYL